MRDPIIPDVYNEVKHKLGFAPNQSITHVWYYFKDHKFTIVAPAKCGSSSIMQFIWMNEIEDSVLVLKQHQVVGETYTIIRDPIDRFCSLWRSKCRDKKNIRDKRIYGMSPSELMTHIESGAKDAHWTQQNRIIGKLDPVLIPLEMLGWWWKQSGLGELGKYNATEGEVDISDKLKARILRFYANDLELYHKAQCDFCWDTVVSPIVDV
jgi:hypothetical protein